MHVISGTLLEESKPTEQEHIMGWKINTEDWSEDERTDAYVIESGTLVDERTGRRYPYGARRVRLLRPIEGFKDRSFFGDNVDYASSYARDIRWAVTR